MTRDAPTSRLLIRRLLARMRERRNLALVLTGVLTYAIGLIALIPASIVLDQGERLKVGGTIWRGEAVLASVLRIDWSFAPLKTLANLGFTADWRMSGGATDLAGSATIGGGVLRLADVSGQADGALLDALAPRLPVTCTVLADVAIDRLVLGGAAQEAVGTLRSSPARCAVRGASGLPLDLPALRGQIAPAPSGSSGALLTASGGQHLVEARLSRGGALSIWPTARAIQLAPFLSGQRYDTVID